MLKLDFQQEIPHTTTGKEVKYCVKSFKREKAGGGVEGEREGQREKEREREREEEKVKSSCGQSIVEPLTLKYHILTHIVKKILTYSQLHTIYIQSTSRESQSSWWLHQTTPIEGDHKINIITQGPSSGTV